MADLGAIANLVLGSSPAKPAVADTGGAFVIQELTGDMRMIVLSGRGLPYRPLELETTQRVKTVWLPGYSIATATILGPQEEPCTINGYWKERFIGQLAGAAAPLSALAGTAAALQSVTAGLTGGFGGQAGNESAAIQVDGKPVTTTQEVVDLFDDVTRQGQLLQVTWVNQRRVGHLKSFKKRWHNTKDAEWDMQFEWVSRGDPVVQSKFAVDVTAKDTRDLLEGALGDIQAIMAELPAIAGALTDLIDSQLQKISSIVDQIGDAVETVAQLASLPANSARRIIGLMKSVEGECFNTAEIIDARTSSAWHIDAQVATAFGGTVTYQDAVAQGLETGQGGIGRLDTAQRANMADFVARMKLSLRVMRNRAVERRTAMERQQQRELAGVFTARAGDDLRDAAFQFYGDASEWRRIMLFNGLRQAELDAGQVVLVPRIAPGGGAGELGV